MLGWLETIVCVLMQIPYFALWAVTEAFNAIVAAVGAVLSAAAAVLPNFPTDPALPDPMGDVLGWINWFFPVDTLIEIVAWMLVVWLVWIVFSIGARWARAI